MGPVWLPRPLHTFALKGRTRCARSNNHGPAASPASGAAGDAFPATIAHRPHPSTAVARAAPGPTATVASSGPSGVRYRHSQRGTARARSHEQVNPRAESPDAWFPSIHSPLLAGSWWYRRVTSAGEDRRRNRRPRAVRSSSMTHWLIGVPFPASNGAPTPSARRAATRSRGSLSTRWPRETIAKMCPLTRRASDPKPRRPDPNVTPPRPARASTRSRKPASTRVSSAPGLAFVLLTLRNPLG